jgi:hypothetical protein
MTTVTAELDGATNVLLAVPPMGGGDEVCQSLLAERVDDPSVLYVSYTQQAGACIEQWERTGASARNLGVITVGDGSTETDRDGVVVENVSSASDLTGLGIQIGQFLSEWDAPVLVCFDSLTSLLQYVDFETAYEFVHAVTGQVHAAGARAHFHIDPSAHDDQQVAGITSLVDAKISVDDEPTVRTRDVIE